MRCPMFKNFWSLSLIYNRQFNFLSWGSKSIQIFQFVLNLIWGCSTCVQICSIWVLNVAGAALFRSWTEVEETIVLNLCSKPYIGQLQQLSGHKQSNDYGKCEKSHSQSEKGTASQNYFRTQNRAISMHLEQPQFRLKTKWKFWTIFEPQHKKFKWLIKLKACLNVFLISSVSSPI